MLNSVKLFDLEAGAGRLYRLSFPNDSMVPAEIQADDENASFTYNLDGFLPVSEISNAAICEKLRMLINISELFRISNEYSFGLNPDNLYIDRNLKPRVLFRDLNGEGNRHNFVEEYKALIGSFINPRYQFDDYLKGGESLYKKKKSLRPLLNAQTVSDVENILSQQYEREFKIQQKEKILVNRKRHKLLKVLMPVSLALFMLSSIIAVYIGYIVLPFQRTLLASEHYFLREDYDGAIDTLKNISPERMPKEERFQLARAYVISESLSSSQKENILSGITVRTEDNILYYWIHMGRLEFDGAIDMANRIGSDELLLYALINKQVYVQNDVTLSGEEKSTQLSQLDQQISRLEKTVSDKEDIIEEEMLGDAEDEEVINDSEEGQLQEADNSPLSELESFIEEALQ